MNSMFPRILSWLFAAIMLVSVFSCQQNEKEENGASESAGPAKEFSHAAWSKDAVIYELNTRQFSEEGTFAAARKHLPRLDELGIDIIWFMPIHPISEKNKKGELGSPYAITDYTAVNPNYGTMDDFKTFVNQAHEKDIRVIIDWVPNHTGWDSKWLEDHPDWYTHDEEGNVIHPEGTDWTDVADLNYDNQDMRNAMTDAMKFWLESVGIDGFRCDVAGSVPTDFWDSTITELRKVNDGLFMLAEAEKPELHPAGFDMSYAWGLHHIMNEVAAGNKTVAEIDGYFAKHKTRFRRQDLMMNFTTNHDENSWNGTAFERFGDGFKTFAVFAATIPGMPLLYNGQEAELKKRLEFFKKDPIEWGDFKYTLFYQELFSLREKNSALWAGYAGGELQRVETGADEAVFAFTRKKGGEKVFVMLNLTEEEQKISIKDEAVKGGYENLYSKEKVDVGLPYSRTLAPWEFVVLHITE